MINSLQPDSTESSNHADIAWRRDLVDLLFMAPGRRTLFCMPMAFSNVQLSIVVRLGE